MAPAKRKYPAGGYNRKPPSLAQKKFILLQRGRGFDHTVRPPRPRPPKTTTTHTPKIKKGTTPYHCVQGSQRGGGHRFRARRGRRRQRGGIFPIFALLAAAAPAIAKAVGLGVAGGVASYAAKKIANKIG